MGLASTMEPGHFVAFLEAAPLPIIARSLNEGVFVFVNKAFEQLSGFDSSFILGKRPDEARFWRDGSDLYGVPARMQRPGLTVALPVSIRTINGDIVECEVSGGPARIGGEVVIISAVVPRRSA